ncbi:DUF475 domain-containing protein [Actinomadura madurae]|uniref:DUF475 domain-containing protein n=1 Tax=Actinomadura madurae TaxID=1993 RepID=UPI00202683FD|nr:DUF475 domain-containing protein [Actinomadura madurae]MCP9954673.1 DUF475 domain-containing protein [Actinomadura madurae]MCP9983901.1 DUF475 domain-containing protein [Actinomadura madurae]URN00168.1 DUF475 domain-containing protein [Actinomadura madurae]URN02327.1 DUF475 domain-containing protein [Actinomadura madurae]
MILRTFGWSFGVTAVGLLLALLYDGPTGLALVAVLAVLEISLSFDNAVVNAKVLDRMSPFWQKIFLTIGIAIAVFGMRLVFPLLIVGITAKLNPYEAFDLALNDSHRYHELMNDAYPMIAAFGGMFLMMLFLDFVFEERADKWLPWLERPLARIGKLDQLPVVVAGGSLAFVAWLAADDPGNVMIAGVLGMVTYILVNGLGELFSEASEPDEEEDGEEAGEGGRSGPSSLALATGKAGFFLFLYLEVLDASFSFDGVIGAFAISTDPIVIALGLGIGAMYIRSLTVFLVRKGTLHEYVYLEHGAHWAIGALAVCMLISIGHHVPEWITGGLGAGLIIAAFASSVVRNRNGGGESSGPAAGGEGDKQLHSSNV